MEASLRSLCQTVNVDSKTKKTQNESDILAHDRDNNENLIYLSREHPGVRTPKRDAKNRLNSIVSNRKRLKTDTSYEKASHKTLHLKLDRSSDAAITSIDKNKATKKLTAITYCKKTHNKPSRSKSKDARTIGGSVRQSYSFKRII